MENKPNWVTACQNQYDCRSCPAIVSCPIVAAAESYAKMRDRRIRIAAEKDAEKRAHVCGGPDSVCDMDCLNSFDEKESGK